jgi:hypothetical protein
MRISKYELLEKIGGGTFGSVYRCFNTFTNEVYAIKLESRDNENNLLKREMKIYQYLGKSQYTPQVKWYGVYISLDKNLNFMVMDLLTTSLNDYKSQLTNTLHSNEEYLCNVKTIGMNMVEIIQYIHSKGIVHRDIKPDNFMFKNNGSGYNHNQLILIDFGFAVKYNNLKLKTTNSILGTPNFISINIHNNMTPNRRDDLESVVYIYLYLLNIYKLDSFKYGNLEKIKMRKLELDKRGFNFLNYCKNLSFYEDPDYSKIITLIEKNNCATFF